ncbi:tRNA N6-adenosine threonylcarbamoyltransferase [Lacunisphaera limnophila]|uniref:tRNA N6-adenosine threonylcarbamoyltransferase n=1 Tax=Lacunisphaera limnophila TaxID=1838286 RepID=A0A1D8AWA3_9BACT|nr:tRNA (adenosine(37)-N6)-threonylcarbamoyltransferase complex transferase subunit TsaD [Lacunisphaera limnophila]AOS45169.1 tRNA N6-adenosine threonylcarbamoyltransferase [Lacunisphaera limnophila]
MILALESSCDETAVAVFDPTVGLTGEWVHSQIALHEAYGGVVPDLASREHLAHFGPLLQRALATVPPEQVTRIVVTQGPGLAACLAMGLAAAKSLALAWRVPVAGVNHLRAHAFSPFIGLHAANPAAFDDELAKLLPHLGLLVSGGNTALFTIDETRRITLLASTMDDAAGEALDKGAKLMGLGYPGGPQVEKLAAAGRTDAFQFPKAVAQRSTLEFSFSGLKTSLRYQLEKMPAAEIESRKADLCASYQAAVFEALVRKARLALERGAYRSFGLSGGVANNRTLQGLLEQVAQAQNVPFLRAQAKHTGDNAGMIAFAAWAEREAGGVDESGLELEIAPSLPLAK